jgi:hypothetical protein
VDEHPMSGKIFINYRRETIRDLRRPPWGNRIEIVCYENI